MKIAIVRVRGDVRITHQVRDTLKMLGLNKKNHCAIHEDSPRLRGMITLVDSIITYGPADDKTTAELKKKGDKIYRLNPPRKGYGRKGVKMPFKRGGAYGNRGEKINDLLMRMM